MTEDHSRITPLPPENLDPPRRGGFGPGSLLVLASLLVAIVVVGSLIGSDKGTPVTTATTTPGPLQPDIQVALLAEDAVWLIDPATLEVVALRERVDEVPWHATITDRQIGNVFYLGPGGTVDLGEVPGTVFAVVLIEGGANLPTSLPAALLPIWSGLRPQGFDLVYVRSRSGGASWNDITPLPGCGLPLPIAEPDAEEALTVWCTDYEAVRVLVEAPDRSVEDEALIVDWSGGIFTSALGATATFESAGAIVLDNGEIVSGIATLSADGQTLFLGISQAGDRQTERSRATRLVAYDRIGNTEAWSTTTPVPFETLTVGPDGTVFAYYSATVGSGPDPALMSIDPETGAATVLLSPLDLGPGRLLILRR